MTRKGKLFGVGVGPGDPELMTLQAVRLLKACDAIAIPQRDADRCLALTIAAGAVPEIREKPLLALDMPMTRDREVREQAYAAAAAALTAVLDEGKDVAFLTLGDPTIYSTYGYVHSRVVHTGYEAAFVPGVPSFCAAAAALGEPLCLDGEALHILPRIEEAEQGTRVYMKGGAARLKQVFKAHDGLILGAEKVGLDGERLYRSLAEIPEETSYFTLIIAKEKPL